MHDPVCSPFQLFQGHQSSPNNHLGQEGKIDEKNRLKCIFLEEISS